MIRMRIPANTAAPVKMSITIFQYCKKNTYFSLMAKSYYGHYTLSYVYLFVAGTLIYFNFGIFS